MLMLCQAVVVVRKLACCVAEDFVLLEVEKLVAQVR